MTHSDAMHRDQTRSTNGSHTGMSNPDGSAGERGSPWRVAARLGLIALLGLAAVAVARPASATCLPREATSALARACESGEGDWVYMGRLGSPFVPCPPRPQAVQPTP